MQGSSTSAPQEDYDPRTLYERLQEQKNIKEELFQEQTRLSNLIKRVDDEEAEYYQTLSDVQEKLDIEQREKEREELDAFRRAVEQTRNTATKTEPPAPQNPKPSTTTNATRRKSSKNALDGLVIVKKKRSSDEKDDDDGDDQPEAKKPKPTEQKEQKSVGSNTLSSLMAAYSSDDSEDE
ncbi:N-terminal domain of NEFA-interacting nuclear protein NIP30-domain-containing protein [Fennellomyces sp. T-0311]|nr:N-terminal domain of NEFA-interacting nuclear protein NIP30-domain-containing protein [Fennellomyces sp. T-0311]